MRALPVLLSVMAVLALAGPAAATAAPGGADEWPVAGHDIANTRDATGEHFLGPRTVAKLSAAWSVTTKGDVRTTPVEADGTVYAPDSGGMLWALDARTGAVRWAHSVSDYTGTAGDEVRMSPAVTGDELVFGDTDTKGNGADVIAVDRRTGALKWRTEVDSHAAAMESGSPVVYRGTVYIGVSSYEETLALTPGYACCSFRGSVVALNARTGTLLWKTYTVPVGYAGGAVWGSGPAINPRRNLLYVGTGNNYSAPPGVCTDPGETGCTPPSTDDHADSILALDMTTGTLRWFRSTMGSDVFTDECGAAQDPNCGPDFDFGSGPNLIQLASGRQLVGIGQKSGVYWALDPATGSVVWHTMVGPGSALGGIEFGSATDGRRVYVAESDFLAQPYRITSAGGVTTTTTGGSWAALDAATGRIVWQVADPQGAADFGYVSTANGVVYAGSTADTGNNMYALDARTGAVRWSFASGGPVVSGAAIVDGSVYWGSGYPVATICPNGSGALRYCAAGNDELFAFRVRN
jgi:polyvinyl alcohol dehydrogenase (cytochrome)